jgi:hypothetical protein
MVEDPKIRLFDQVKNPEIFLELKNLLLCDYIYTVSNDLKEDLDKKLLIKNMYSNLTNEIYKFV